MQLREQAKMSGKQTRGRSQPMPQQTSGNQDEPVADPTKHQPVKMNVSGTRYAVGESY